MAQAHIQAKQSDSRSAASGVLSAHPKASYYILLVLAVTACFFGANALVFLTGREAVWTADAQPLYVNFLTWWVQTVHQLVADFFAGRPVQIPDYTYSLGYGADVPMTMGSYLQDPINLVALLFPVDKVPVAYTVMAWLRMVLCAITFSAYCFAHGNGRKATGIAAIVYATCGYVLFWGLLRHPKFIDWAILIPMMFLGADRMFKRQGPGLLLVSFALQFFTSLYTSYMSCLAILIYCLVKYFFAPRNRSVADFVILAAKVFVVVFAAFLVSALFSLPQLGALLGQSRATSGASDVALFNTVKYYLKIGVELVGADVTTNSLVLGAVATLSLSVFVLCGKRFDAQVRRPWYVAFLLCAVGMVFPFFGHVFNGMGYSTDRWGLLAGFVASYIVCLTVPVLPKLDARDWKRVLIASAAIAVTGFAFSAGQVFTEDGALGVVWPFTMTAFFVAVVFVAKHVSQRSSRKAVTSFMLAAALVGPVATCCFYNSPLGFDWMVMFSKTGNVAHRIGDGGPAGPIDHLGDDSLFRFTYPSVYEGMKNSSLTHGTMAVDFYSSYYPQASSEFRLDLGLADHYLIFSYMGSDARLAVDSITGVKYFVFKDGDEWRIPYGYVDTGSDYGEYHVYRNEHAVPLAFTMDGVLSRSEYEAMTMAQRQEALLQAVVVEDDVAKDAKSADITISSESIPYQVVETKGLEVGQNSISVKKEKATLTLQFDGLPKSETYLCLTNFRAESYTPTQLAHIKGEEPDLITRISELGFRKNTEFPMRATMGDNSHSFTLAMPRHVRYGGKHDWAVNMGYNEQAQTQITLRFSEVGEYTFDSLDVVCQPVEPIAKQADALADRGLSDLKLETDHVSATVRLAEDEPVYALFTIGYAQGWRAEVDGEPAELTRADTGFMAVRVEGEGEHDIALYYSDPYARIGAYVSLAGLVVAVVLLVASMLRRRREADRNVV